MKNNKKILVAVLAIICVVLIATITVIITDKDDTNEVDASGKNNNPVAAIFNKGGITSKDETQGESESESQTESETSTEETENQQTEGSSMNETDSVRPQETPDDTTGAAPSETQPSETPSETQPSETPSVETQPSETHPQEPDTPEDEPDETQDDTQPDSSEENPAYGTVVIGYSMSDEPRSYNNYMGWKLVVQTYIYSERDSEWTEGGFTPYSVQAWEVNEILKLGRPQAKPDSAGTDGEQRDVYMWVWLD